MKERGIIGKSRPHRMMAPLFALVVLMGCTERPSDRIGTAERLVSEAQQGHAAIYAEEEVQRLERLLITLHATVQEQDGYPRLIRDYEKVLSLADTITRDAEEVIEESARIHDHAQAQASAVLEEAEEALADTQRRIAEMKQRHGLGRIRRQANDSEALGSHLVSAKEALDSEDYIAAEARAHAILAHVQSLTDQVDAIAIRYGDTPPQGRTQLQ